MTRSDELTRSFRFLELAVIGSFILLALVTAGSFLWIQHSRLESCRHNYKSFDEVFKPFRKNAPPATLTRLDQVHKTVLDLRSRCSKQVSPFAW